MYNKLFYTKEYMFWYKTEFSYLNFSNSYNNFSFEKNLCFNNKTFYKSLFYKYYFFTDKELMNRLKFSEASEFTNHININFFKKEYFFFIINFVNDFKNLSYYQNKFFNQYNLLLTYDLNFLNLVLLYFKFNSVLDSFTNNTKFKKSNCEEVNFFFNGSLFNNILNINNIFEKTFPNEYEIICNLPEFYIIKNILFNNINEFFIYIKKRKKYNFYIFLISMYVYIYYEKLFFNNIFFNNLKNNFNKYINLTLYESLGFFKIKEKINIKTFFLPEKTDWLQDFYGKKNKVFTLHSEYDHEIDFLEDEFDVDKNDDDFINYNR